MLGELWNALLEYLKRTPYWPVLEPFLLIGFLYVAACVVLYQFVQWRYGVTLELGLFLRSHLLWQASIGFTAIVGSFIALTVGREVPRKAKSADAGISRHDPGDRSGGRARSLERGLAGRVGVVLLICALALYLLHAWSPTSNVSPIRVRFAAFDAFVATAASTPDAARQSSTADYQQLRAVTQYLLYEINHRQRAWQLQFETTPFRTDMVGKSDEERCATDDTPPLCIAEAFRASARRNASHPPLVLITPQPLGGGGTRAWFWLNRGPVSVVTMADWGGAGAPGSIEYLAYALVVQSVMIHMQAHCGLAQPPQGTPDGVVVGNVFDLQPGLHAMHAAVLTGHFSQDDERRLLNCFGPEYMRTAVELVGLRWLRAGQVRENLKNVYGVDLMGN